MTDSGRTVYGGGGITPDEDCTAPKLDPLQAQLFRTGLFDFTRSYFATHPPKLPAGWMPDDATFQQLHDYLESTGTASRNPGSRRIARGFAVTWPGKCTFTPSTWTKATRYLP